MSILAAILLLLVASTLHAQPTVESLDREPWTLGMWLGYGFGSLRGAWAADRDLGIVPAGECGAFETGSASQLSGGLGVERALDPQWRLRLALDVQWLQGTMHYPCVDPAQARMPDGSLADASTEFIADVELLSTSARFLVAVAPFEAPVILAGGPYVSLRLGGDYSAREEIRSPSGASFISGGQQRDLGGRDFGDASISGGLAASVRFEAVAGPRLSLVPELDLRLSLFDDVPAARLAHDDVIFSLGLHYRFAAPDNAPTPLDMD